MKPSRAFLIVTSCIALAGLSRAADLSNPREVQKEVERIQKKYPNDPLKAAQEVDRLVTRPLAEKAGISGDIQKAKERRDALFRKYGIPELYTVMLGAHGNVAGYILDRSAWHFAVERKGNRMAVVFHLDRERYKVVGVVDPVVVFRTMGQTPEQEAQMESGEFPNDGLWLPLAVSRIGENVFKVEVVCPSSDQWRFALQVSAALDPEWRTLAVISLETKAQP